MVLNTDTDFKFVNDTQPVAPLCISKEGKIYFQIIFFEDSKDNTLTLGIFTSSKWATPEFYSSKFVLSIDISLQNLKDELLRRLVLYKLKDGRLDISVTYGEKYYY